MEETVRTTKRKKVTAAQEEGKKEQQVASVSAKKKRASSIEFRPTPGDETLARTLQQQDAGTGKQGTLAAVYKESLHIGLMVRAALMGPDQHGLYAGCYSGEQMAQLIRLWALGLTDCVARHSTPIYQSQFLASPQSPSGTSGNGVPPSMSETKMDERGVASLKGLGTGLLRRRTPPSSPEASQS